MINNADRYGSRANGTVLGFARITTRGLSEMDGHDSEITGHDAVTALYASVSALRIELPQAGTLAAFLPEKQCLRQGYLCEPSGMYCV